MTNRKCASQSIQYRERLYRFYSTNHRGANFREMLERSTNGAPYFRHLIHKYFPKDKNVGIVDLGCGYGALLYFLRKAGYYNLEGIDRSLEQVQGAHLL